MTRLVKSYTLIAVAMCFAVGGCDKSGDKSASGSDAAAGKTSTAKYKVVCTVGMITDLAQQIAGERAEVTGIIGAAVDPHLYQATRNDIVKLNEADVVFYNGLLLEGKMSDILEKVGGISVSSGINPERFIAPPDATGHHDPHIWMDVSIWMDVALRILEGLTDHDEVFAKEYRVRLNELLPEMDKLNRYAREAIASIPEESRVLITAHDAFEYFGRAYGIEVRGIQGISTESEAGVRDINELVDLIVTRKIKAVFVESSVSKKNITALVEGAAARGHELKIGGTLYSDAMGPAGTYEGTYVGMIDHNVTTITRALGGTAPEKGLNGKLSGAE